MFLNSFFSRKWSAGEKEIYDKSLCLGSETFSSRLADFNFFVMILLKLFALFKLLI